MCMLKWIIGVGIIIGAVIVEISWLAICFGSIILGVVLLFFATDILFAPFTIGTTAGLLLMSDC